MSGGRGPSLPSRYQWETVTGAKRDAAPSSLSRTTEDWAWRQPLYPTNSSSTEQEHRSGLVPGLIAASIFIMFLLCLYTILWRCMVSQAHRQAKRHRRKRTSTSREPQKPICAV
ncbi:uncharacterized protein WCC33_005582 [Rhinophrynus dorsalis]